MVLVATLAVGCAIPTWRYEPGLKPGAVGDRPQLQAAVLRFTEGRQQIDPSTGKVFLTYVPVLPYVEDDMQMTDEGAKEFARKMNAAPQPEFLTLSSRSFHDELKESEAFEFVDYEPTFRDDYDIVFKGELKSTLTKFRYTSYGLGMAGVLLWLFPLPVGRLQQFYEYEVTASDGTGNAIASVAAKAERIWWAGLYYGLTPEKAYKQFSDMMRETNRKVLEELLPDVDKHLGDDLEAVVAARKQRYYQNMDPGILDFERAASEPGNRQADFQAAYDLKVELLERLRLVERSLSDREQEAKTKAFREEMEQVAAAQRRQMEQAMQQAAAGMAGAAGSMNSLNSLGDMNDFQKAMAIASEVNKVYQESKQLETQAAEQSSELRAQHASLVESHLEKFRNISGTRNEIRSRWLDRYREETPRYRDVSQGRWTAQHGFDVPAPAPVQAAAVQPQVELAEGEGGVLVTSTPSNSDLLINGEFYGMTPTSTLTFPLETQLELEVRHEGYQPFARTLTLRTSNVLRINAALTPVDGTQTDVSQPDAPAPAQIPTVP